MNANVELIANVVALRAEKEKAISAFQNAGGEKEFNKMKKEQEALEKAKEEQAENPRHSDANAMVE